MRQFWFCGALFFLFSAPSFAATDSQRRGDDAFRRRAEPVMATLALTSYREAFRQDPCAETAWRVAAAAYFEGYRHPHTDEEREHFYAEGRDAGREGVRRDPACAPCHFWTAVNMALYGQVVGPFKMLFSLSEVLQHLETVARLDPHYASAGAYRMQGMIWQTLPGILGGSHRRARAFFDQAISLAPGDPLNYWALWHLLLDQDRTEEARTLVTEALRFPIPERNQVEAHEAYTDMRDGVQRLHR